MAARLERDIDCCALCFITRLLQCENFRMGFTGPLVPTLANDLPVAGDDTTDTRVGVSRFQTANGQLQGTGHALEIKCVKAH
jgi:hypothetical protein